MTSKERQPTLCSPYSATVNRRSLLASDVSTTLNNSRLPFQFANSFPQVRLDTAESLTRSELCLPAHSLLFHLATFGNSSTPAIRFETRGQFSLGIHASRRLPFHNSLSTRPLPHRRQRSPVLLNSSRSYRSRLLLPLSSFDSRHLFPLNLIIVLES